MTTTQTFQERINDRTKPELHINFIRFIRHLAQENKSTNENEVYAMWRDYSNKCAHYDQSPVKSEFCQWYRLKCDEHLLRQI